MNPMPFYHSFSWWKHTHTVENAIPILLKNENQGYYHAPQIQWQNTVMLQKEFMSQFGQTFLPKSEKTENISFWLGLHSATITKVETIQAEKNLNTAEHINHKQVFMNSTCKISHNTDCL